MDQLGDTFKIKKLFDIHSHGSKVLSTEEYTVKRSIIRTSQIIHK